MRITILTVGSRGDVQPFIALGIGLKRAGYKVQLATESAFKAFVSEYGLEFAPLRAEFVQLAQSDKGKAALSGKKSLSLIKLVMPMLRNMLDDAWDAAKDSDVIIYHPKSIAGQHIAEKLDIPCFLAMVLPALSPTRAFSNPVIGGRNYGSYLNKLSYTLMLTAMLLPYKKMINRWRAEKLGMLPGKSDLKMRGQPIPKLYGYSQHILPPLPDWDDTTHVTGYWFLPSQTDWQAPHTLLTFLKSGPAPIYVGFGSMASQDAERLTHKVLEAARESKQRVVLATGWGGLVTAELPEFAYALQSVPHDWLFPRCAAVIHHGGAGTTGTGLQAGKPTLVCPFFGDQPFWGRRTFELGIGPQPIPQKKLTAENLAQSMCQLTNDEAIRQKARALGERICSEDGVAEAVKVIRNYLS
jgi:sterol 3beta-glucosyltransferase